MILERLEKQLKEITQKMSQVYPEAVLIEEPPSSVEADFSTNLAMQLAKQSKGNPRELAEQIKTELQKGEGIEKVEIAGPGFLNISLNDSFYLESLNPHEIFQTPTPQKINLEFISANPTGPLHIGNARGGPIGETIGRALEKIGHTVTREFVVNDIGGQANQFAASVLHFYLQHFGKESTFPEKGYPGQYIQDLAKEIVEADGEKYLNLPEGEQKEAMRQVAIRLMTAKIKTTTEKMGINFDRFFAQSELHENGLSTRILKELQQNDATLEKDGATWLASGQLEDDRETVLVKSTGEYTYFLDDIAYHYDKLVERGFDKAIVLMGANHFGHIPRMKAGLQAIKINPDRYEGSLYQQVQLKVDGQAVKMAKREGNFVTADEVLEQVPRDVFSYFLLSKGAETHLDFDLQLAKDTSEKNPVYYIQYAHARICSLLELAKEKNLVPAKPGQTEFAKEERALIAWLDKYNLVIQEVAETYRTHLFPAYAYELATRFHHFYAHQRIITDNIAESTKRLYLCQLTANTLKDVLSLMNITAFEKM